MVDVAYHAEIWDPVTGKWTRGASVAKPRLYHSTAVLLPDATVLTSGGGAPGPVINLNSEIYYPPYLFAKDGSGKLLPRPTIASAPTSARLGSSFAVKIGAGQTAARVTLIHVGSATHSNDTDQRYMELKFTQAGTDLSISVPTNQNLAPPGHYMLFVIDRAGVPSVAKVVRILAA